VWGPAAGIGRGPRPAVGGKGAPVGATLFREGHEAVAATAVLVAPGGTDHSSARMVDVSPGNDRYQAHLVPDGEGMWGFRVEGWSDPYGTWRHDAVLKVHAEVDTELMLTEGGRLLQRAVAELDLTEAQEQVL